MFNFPAPHELHHIGLIIQPRLPNSANYSATIRDRETYLSNDITCTAGLKVANITTIMSIQQWVTPLEGLDSLRQTEAPMVSPSPGEVLVKVHAVSLNYRDVEG